MDENNDLFITYVNLSEVICSGRGNISFANSWLLSLESDPQRCIKVISFVLDKSRPTQVGTSQIFVALRLFIAILLNPCWIEYQGVQAAHLFEIIFSEISTIMTTSTNISSTITTSQYLVCGAKLLCTLRFIPSTLYHLGFLELTAKFLRTMENNLLRSNETTQVILKFMDDFILHYQETQKLEDNWTECMVSENGRRVVRDILLNIKCYLLRLSDFFLCDDNQYNLDCLYSLLCSMKCWTSTMICLNDRSLHSALSLTEVLDHDAYNGSPCSTIQKLCKLLERYYFSVFRILSETDKFKDMTLMYKLEAIVRVVVEIFCNFCNSIPESFDESQLALSHLSIYFALAEAWRCHSFCLSRNSKSTTEFFSDHLVLSLIELAIIFLEKRTAILLKDDPQASYLRLDALHSFLSRKDSLYQNDLTFAKEWKSEFVCLDRWNTLATSIMMLMRECLCYGDISTSLTTVEILVYIPETIKPCGDFSYLVQEFLPLLWNTLSDRLHVPTAINSKIWFQAQCHYDLLRVTDNGLRHESYGDLLAYIEFRKESKVLIDAIIFGWPSKFSFSGQDHPTYVLIGGTARMLTSKLQDLCYVMDSENSQSQEFLNAIVLDIEHLFFIVNSVLEAYRDRLDEHDRENYQPALNSLIPIESFLLMVIDVSSASESVLNVLERRRREFDRANVSISSLFDTIAPVLAPHIMMWHVVLPMVMFQTSDGDASTVNNLMEQSISRLISLCSLCLNHSELGPIALNCIETVVSKSPFTSLCLDLIEEIFRKLTEMVQSFEVWDAKESHGLNWDTIFRMTEKMSNILTQFFMKSLNHNWHSQKCLEMTGFLFERCSQNLQTDTTTQMLGNIFAEVQSIDGYRKNRAEMASTVGRRLQYVTLNLVILRGMVKGYTTDADDSLRFNGHMDTLSTYFRQLAAIISVGLSSRISTYLTSFFHLERADVLARLNSDKSFLSLQSLCMKQIDVLSLLNIKIIDSEIYSYAWKDNPLEYFQDVQNDFLSITNCLLSRFQWLTSIAANNSAIISSHHCDSFIILLKAFQRSLDTLIAIVRWVPFSSDYLIRLINQDYNQQQHQETSCRTLVSVIWLYIRCSHDAIDLYASVYQPVLSTNPTISEYYVECDKEISHVVKNSLKLCKQTYLTCPNLIHVPSQSKVTNEMVFLDNSIFDFLFHIFVQLTNRYNQSSQVKKALYRNVISVALTIQQMSLMHFIQHASQNMLQNSCLNHSFCSDENVVNHAKIFNCFILLFLRSDETNRQNVHDFFQSFLGHLIQSSYFFSSKEKYLQDLLMHMMTSLGTLMEFYHMTIVQSDQEQLMHKFSELVLKPWFHFIAIERKESSNQSDPSKVIIDSFVQSL